MTFHRSPSSSNALWIFKRATNKKLPHSNGLLLAMTFLLCWKSCNPKRPRLPPDKYVTVIPVQSTKLRDAEKQLMDQCQKLTHQARNFAQRLALRSKPEKSWP